MPLWPLPNSSKTHSHGEWVFFASITAVIYGIQGDAGHHILDSSSACRGRPQHELLKVMARNELLYVFLKEDLELTRVDNQICELCATANGPLSAVKPDVQLIMLNPGLSSIVTDTSPKSEQDTGCNAISLSEREAELSMLGLDLSRTGLPSAVVLGSLWLTPCASADSAPTNCSPGSPASTIPTM
eukprot:CAMPEP_0180701334 /NCGR_PEP_ID=MMETSP1038_2-20121128/5547_1 /TAXON_ID=632150 /ORGANISM="Azadinium spinosum, Strain 3D9" /LENGTH=185 /DNA_ID=CAMNT_0022733053 /DNA_START=221 /DNA_END=779 /DNA_ORIENTATION=-